MSTKGRKLNVDREVASTRAVLQHALQRNDEAAAARAARELVRAKLAAEEREWRARIAAKDRAQQASS